MSTLKPKQLAFLNELYEKEWSYFKVYDHYKPDYTRTLLTKKFYSKYEGHYDEEPDPELMEKIKRAKYDGPREKQLWPMTENQRYGWVPQSLVPLRKDDRRFYHCHNSADFVKHGVKLRQDESIFPKDTFTGVPFKVQ